MARPAPHDPQLLAATVAVRRAAAEGRSDSSFEAMGAARMRGSDVDPAVAARIVRRFEGLNAGMRQSALGQYLDAPVTLQPVTPPTGGTSTGGGSAAGAGRFRVGITEAMADRIRDAIDATPASVYTVTYQGMVCEAET